VCAAQHQTKLLRALHLERKLCSSTDVPKKALRTAEQQVLLQSGAICCYLLLPLADLEKRADQWLASTGVFLLVLDPAGRRCTIQHQNRAASLASMPSHR
jgi:hypothetical protein